MKRVRNGRTQVFTEGNLTLKLRHEKKEMFAKLIDGAWYWVSGCAECNGKERSWSTYIECEKHDRCSKCGTNRKDIKGDVWGGRKGWTCNPCMEVIRLEAKEEAFEKLGGREPDCTYRDKIICAHCGSDISSSDLYESQDIECDVCEGEMHLEIEYTPTYSTSVKGERVTV